MEAKNPKIFVNGAEIPAKFETDAGKYKITWDSVTDADANANVVSMNRNYYTSTGNCFSHVPYTIYTTGVLPGAMGEPVPKAGPKPKVGRRVLDEEWLGD